MATIKGREQARCEAINSIVHQVDMLTVAWGQQTGDAAKFTGLIGDYIFIVDDDLIYPGDYVQTMIQKIEHYGGRKVVITAHGRSFVRHPIQSYYNSPSRCVHCLKENTEDQPVEIAGTGVLAFHRGAVNIGLDDFKEKNMADIWFSIACQKQGVKRIAIEHKAGWIRHSKHVDLDATIAHQYRHNDKPQTEAINSISW